MTGSHPRWRSLKEAAQWAQEQGIQGKEQWEDSCRVPGWRPKDIPFNPAAVYGQAFIDMGRWGGFLNTNRIATRWRTYRPVADASAWAQDQGVTGREDWTRRTKEKGWLPQDIPVDLAGVYGEAFNAIGGWVGFLNLTTFGDTSKIERMLAHVLEDCVGQPHRLRQPSLVGASRQKWSVDVALEVMHLVVEYDGSSWHTDEDRDRKKTADLTVAGWQVVRLRGQNGAVRLALLDPVWDLAVDERLAPHLQVAHVLTHLASLHDQGLLPFPAAALAAMDRWKQDLPTYNFREVLAKFDGFRSYEAASAWARAQGVASANDWRKRSKQEGWRPDDIPHNPHRTYSAEFEAAGGWGGFLGTGIVANQSRSFRPIEAAAAWAQAQGVRTCTEWFAKVKEPGWLPGDIPVSPSEKYGPAFRDMGGWKGFLARTFVPIETAMAWARAQGIQTGSQWRAACSAHPEARMPTDPARVYGEAFQAVGKWQGFLGTA